MDYALYSTIAAFIISESMPFLESSSNGILHFIYLTLFAFKTTRPPVIVQN